MCKPKNHLSANSYCFLWLLIFLFASGCSSSKEQLSTYNFFEKHGDTLKTLQNLIKEPIIQKNDQLSIVVYSASLNQEQTQVFNLLSNSQSQGGNPMVTQGYLVDFDGNISMPVIGKIKAASLTKTQLNTQLVQKLSPYVKDPIINIRFLNFRVILLGEVVSPGPQTFVNERATIIDAIGQAGGLTPAAKRTNIMVLREGENGTRTSDTLNINDSRIFASSSYQLQQNDVVYVSPYDSKIKSVNTNPTVYRDIPFAIGLISTFLLLVNLLFK